MAIRLSITPEDVRAEKLVRPGWYPVEIKEVKEAMAKDQVSSNIVVDVEGLEGDAKQVPIKNFFSEKFPQGGIAFARACGAKITEEEGIDPNFDWELQKGRKVKAHIVTNKGKSGQDKPRNAIDDWAPMSVALDEATAAAVGSEGFEV